jgi:hypothetical protein
MSMRHPQLAKQIRASRDEPSPVAAVTGKEVLRFPLDGFSVDRIYEWTKLVSKKFEDWSLLSVDAIGKDGSYVASVTPGFSQKVTFKAGISDAAIERYAAQMAEQGKMLISTGAGKATIRTAPKSLVDAQRLCAERFGVRPNEIGVRLIVVDGIIAGCRLTDLPTKHEISKRRSILRGLAQSPENAGIGNTSWRVWEEPATRSATLGHHIDPLLFVEEPVPSVSLDLRRGVQLGISGPDGLPFHLGIEENTCIIAGASGSGKGSLLWGLVRGLEHRLGRDVQICMIDLKGGRESSLANDLFWKRATTLEDAVMLLEGLVQLMKERQDRGANSGARKHTPSEEEPLILVAVDEFAALISYGSGTETKKLQNRAKSAMELLFSQGRSEATLPFVFLQDPSADTLGNLRRLARTKIMLRYSSDIITEAVLGSGMVERGAECSKISQSMPGTFYAVDEDGDPIRARAAFVTDESILELTQRVGARIQAAGRKFDHFLESNGITVGISVRTDRNGIPDTAATLVWSPGKIAVPPPPSSKVKLDLDFSDWGDADETGKIATTQETPRLFDATPTMPSSGIFELDPNEEW